MTMGDDMAEQGKDCKQACSDGAPMANGQRKPESVKASVLPKGCCGAMMLFLFLWSSFVTYQYPWVIPLAIQVAMGVRPPPASAWQTVKVTNNSASDLVVGVHVVNNASFWVYDGWSERQREQIGYRRDIEGILSAGSEKVFALPSESEHRIALLLVTARTQMTSPPLRQRVGIFLLSWPWENGCWKGYDSSSPTGWPVIPLVIEDKDLTLLDVEVLLKMQGDSLRQIPINIIRK